MPNNILNYRSDLKQTANKLRHSNILAEVIMWNKLKAGQISNYRFRRQKPIGPYIVDFYCPKLKLVIEIDGYSHKNKINYDKQRDQYLKVLNLKVLHYTDKDILNNIENIIISLQMWVNTNTPLSSVIRANTPQPPSRGE